MRWDCCIACSQEEIWGLNMIAMQSQFETGLYVIAILFKKDQIWLQLSWSHFWHIWSQLETIAAIRLQSFCSHMLSILIAFNRQCLEYFSFSTQFLKMNIFCVNKILIWISSENIRNLKLHFNPSCVLDPVLSRDSFQTFRFWHFSIFTLVAKSVEIGRNCNRVEIKIETLSKISTIWD